MLTRGQYKKHMVSFDMLCSAMLCYANLCTQSFLSGTFLYFVTNGFIFVYLFLDCFGVNTTSLFCPDTIALVFGPHSTLRLSVSRLRGVTTSVPRSRM